MDGWNLRQDGVRVWNLWGPGLDCCINCLQILNKTLFCWLVFISDFLDRKQRCAYWRIITWNNYSCCLKRLKDWGYAIGGFLFKWILNLAKSKV